LSPNAHVVVEIGPMTMFMQWPTMHPLGATPDGWHARVVLSATGTQNRGAPVTGTTGWQVPQPPSHEVPTGAGSPVHPVSLQ